MYSREDRKKAVELWLKYDKCATAVTNELGYPCTKMLKSWHKDLIKEQETGVIHERRRRTSTYSEKQKKIATEHYREHGRCYARTVRALGYPCLELLTKWCKDYAPVRRKHSKDAVQFSSAQKQEAVISLCCRHGSGQKIADSYGTSRTTLYK